MRLKRKDLLGIEDLTRDELELILSTAASFKEVSEREIKKVPTGPMVGKYLQALFEEVVEKGLVNEREVLVEKLRGLSV